MEKLVKIAEELNLKGGSISLDSSRHRPEYRPSYKGSNYSQSNYEGLSTHCVDCNPTNC